MTIEVRVPRSLLESPDDETVIEACYFVVRVFRHSTPGNQAGIGSAEPSPEARELALRAIAEIEEYERKPISWLDGGRVEEYVSSLDELQARHVGANDPERSETLLKEWRMSESG